MEIQIEASEYCPMCEEHIIKKELLDYIQEEDIEEALPIACDKSTICNWCRMDELDDERRI